MSTRPSPTDREAFDALLRTRLAAFTRKTFATVDPGAAYKHNWHIDLIAEYLEACSRREIKRLVINIPPRYLKSISVTVAWPAWLLGHDPSERILAASYAEILSLKHSMDCRLVMQSDWYRRVFPAVQLTGDQNEKRKFVTTARGCRFATSVGASTIGEGGRFLIVDDPLNAAQAVSDVERERANTWFDQGFSTRLDDKEDGVIVLVMQRLHANDLSGHLLAKGGWEHLCIPAVAETKTVIDFGRVKITREPGDVLHPERESAEAIDRQKVAMGGYAFAGQYQQRPAPAEGGIFKAAWFQRFAARQDDYLQVVQSWDTAIKADQLNDPSVCLTFGVKPDGFDLLEARVQRLEYPDLKRRVHAQAEAFGPDAILIEDKASGQQLLQDLGRSTTLPLIGILPEKDKVTRASGVSALVEAGKLFLPTQAPWLPDFESELLTFPNSVHDDQCLVAGTKVATRRGQIEIESVRVGDEVMTPDGWRKVLASGMTGTKPVVERFGIMGTGNHPVFTLDRGYQDMDSLTQVSLVSKLSLCGLIQIALLKSLRSMESPTAGWADAGSITSLSQRLMRAGRIRKVYMSQFGSFIRAGQYRKTTKLITLTATHLIASQTIWSAYRLNCIGNCLRSLWTLTNSAGTLSESDRSQVNGTARERVASGIVITQKKSQADRGQLFRTPAITAAVRLQPSERGQDTATINAAHSTAGSTKRDTLGNAPVYNLTVEAPHCYYANGILVHNCDALTQFLNWIRGKMLTTAPRIRNL